MATRRMERSRTFPVSVEHAYDTVLPRPLPDIFGRRFGAIPAIGEVIDQHGDWGAAVGQTRTIRLTDGGTMRETLTELDRPHRFGYTISDITGMMKPLVVSAAGTWSFEPVGTGVRITWAWEVTPTEKLGTWVMPTFARLWSGYARQAMEQIEGILLP
ncbi:MAG: SRPBCC family protein [Actinomycetota bacterium]|nr:SRPBCC family protein [Actinomycetota bacterium]